MTNTTHYFSLGLITAAVATLTACGGGSSSNEPAVAPTISGVAATGLAISGGSVSLKCVSGTAAAVATNTDGSYNVPATGLTLPCLARVDFGTAQKLHTLVSALGNANITPVTDLVLANLVKGTAASAFDNFDAATVKTYDAAKVSAALTGVKAYLTSLGVDTSRLALDPIGTKLVAATVALPGIGDDTDQVLDQLKIKLGTKTIEAAGLELAAITPTPAPAAPTPVASSPAAAASATQPAASAPASTPAPAAQTITFAGPGAQTLGASPAALSAATSSGLAATFTSATSAVCTVSGTALTLVAVGNCTITANQAGNTGYAAATPVSITFKVAAAPLKAQAITFAQPANQTMGVATPALSANADSGLAVSFASTTPAVCTVSGVTLTLVAAGTCSVTATQTGNASFSGATAVARSFTVAAAPVVNSAANGKVLYTTNSVLSCANCHGTPPSLQKVLNGANNPTRILSAINSNAGGMGMFAGKLSTQQLNDLAAYLATPNL
ncbi:MAG: cytochrome c [Rhodoferax sp.]|uniref:c-type cytochrome n=1 Tax=Rhodoferax sp. TaxID=50421 RepID=UPI002614CB50|nr:cytochrome c [Rhodoferax sp.]MDD2880059.1 cytochrome c [Rhodoferax sp.]